MFNQNHTPIVFTDLQQIKVQLLTHSCKIGYPINRGFQRFTLTKLVSTHSTSATPLPFHHFMEIPTAVQLHIKRYRLRPLALNLVKVFGNRCHSVSSRLNTDISSPFHCFLNPHRGQHYTTKIFSKLPIHNVTGKQHQGVIYFGRIAVQDLTNDLRG